jgi:hypothetical protein
MVKSFSLFPRRSLCAFSAEKPSLDSLPRGNFVNHGVSLEIEEKLIEREKLEALKSRPKGGCLCSGQAAMSVTKPNHNTASGPSALTGVQAV